MFLFRALQQHSLLGKSYQPDCCSFIYHPQGKHRRPSKRIFGCMYDLISKTSFFGIILCVLISILAPIIPCTVHDWKKTCDAYEVMTVPHQLFP